MKDFFHLAHKAILIVIILLTTRFYSQAQNWDQIIKANAADRNDKPTSVRGEDEFGYAIAVSGDYAVIGALGEDEDAGGGNTLSSSGAAYILHKINGKWKQIRKISPSVRDVYYHFGWSVSISGDYAIVSANMEELTGSGGEKLPQAGAAYIFKKNQGGEDNWGEIKRITASKPEFYDNFGSSVSISGEYVVVGAYLASKNASEAVEISSAGGAYVFKKNQGGTDNWGQIKKLVASDRAENDQFGTAVAISGENIIVGSPFDDLTGPGNTVVKDAGSAYIFAKNQGGSDNWGQVKKIIMPNLTKETHWGGSVSIDGDLTLIGYTDYSGVYTYPEAAYIFDKNTGGANNWGLVKELVASQPFDGDEFGFSVSIKGDYAIVGARVEKEDANDQNTIKAAGSAYIFKRNQGGANNWGRVKKITASDRAYGALFGHAVAIDGETALASAWQEKLDDKGNNSFDYAGAVYIFDLNQGGAGNWGFVKKSVIGEITPEDNFGYSVAISGNYAVVGSPYEDEDRYGRYSLPDAGAAYIFFNNSGTWVQVRKLSPTTRAPQDHFGASVAINGQYIIVGAPQNDTDMIEEGYLENAGAAYIFFINQGEEGNWGQVKKVVASNRHANDFFGQSVAMSANVAAVGSPNTDGESGNNNYGSAYVYAKDLGGADNWGQTQELVADVRIGDANFGESVSVDGHELIIGAPGDAYNFRGQFTLATGAAYVFKKYDLQKANWTMLQKIYASTPAYNDRFGHSVSMSNGYAIVGAYNKSQNSSNSNYISDAGAAYIYKRDQGGADNWGLVKMITATTRWENDHFGKSVSISGQFAIVGAPMSDLNIIEEGYSENAGATYIFRKDLGGADNWGQVQKITPTSRRGASEFGSAVAISELYAIIGSPLDDQDVVGQNTLPGAGSAFIFHTKSAPLPVKLTNFDAEKSEKQTLLSWTTTSEVNSDYFEIQKSGDAKTWVAIGEITSSGDSDALNNYSFTDQKPFSGNNFYRLKMVDRDGTFAYSRIRTLTFDHNKNIIIYPNPVTDKIFVSADDLSKVASVRMINAMGQVVVSTSGMTAQGIVTRHLTAGIYIIQIKKTDGEMQAERVVVAR
jgi:hypothetical protein